MFFYLQKDFHILIKVLILYSVPKSMIKQHNKTVGIDLGINNLMTVSGDIKPLIIDGKYIKSINQFFNKQFAKLKSFTKNVISNKIKTYMSQ